ncbi:42575_t:CDS:1, partial [Gigaspora margarita]
CAQNHTKQSKQLDEFIQLIEEVKKNNQYVKYGLYLESHARTRGWSDLLSEICPDLSLMKAKASL